MTESQSYVPAGINIWHWPFAARPEAEGAIIDIWIFSYIYK